MGAGADSGLAATADDLAALLIVDAGFQPSEAYPPSYESAFGLDLILDGLEKASEAK